MNSDRIDADLQRAAEAIASADALLIGAGAGMGVDSGLPDFRGVEGFWRAYPPFRKLQKSFQEMSNPHWFHADPAQAWGFFGHRLQLYRSAVPHAGFEILRRWGESRRQAYFVFTSNVDGQFQKAGFDAERIIECHGSIHHLQCVKNCRLGTWEAIDIEVEVDPETFCAAGALPTCRHCGGLARPNILMFGDFDWQEARSEEQLARYQAWLGTLVGRRLVAIECGAGLAIPTVRLQCESRANQLIRINLRDSAVPSGCIPLPLRASEALERIDELIA